MTSYVYSGQHLPLTELKQEHNQGNIHNGYILNSPPAYPRPELHVSHVSHTTHLQGLQGIQRDGGFRDPFGRQGDQVVWFSLTVSGDDLRDAETRTVAVVGPRRRVEAWAEGGTLQDFATSPAFRSSSRYGSFRFTFSLRDVLDKYSQQFCGGRRPVLRVYRTVLYQKEVMYAVLVHSPNNNRWFSQWYPLLKESRICAFRAKPEPHFIWRPESMSEDYRFGLVLNNGGAFSQVVNGPNYYLWDNVALALHVDNEVLRFQDEELRESLRYCVMDVISVPRDPRLLPFQFTSFKYAQRMVRKLWRHYKHYSYYWTDYDYYYYYDKYYYYLQWFRDSEFNVDKF